MLFFRSMVLSLALLATSAAWSSRCTGNTCTFDASASTGSIKGYTWTLRHGKDSVIIGSAKVLTYQFPTSGTDTVRGAVLDATSNRWYYSTKVIVHAGPTPVRVDTVRVPYAVHDTVRLVRVDTVLMCPPAPTPTPIPTPAPAPTPIPTPTPLPSAIGTLAELPRLTVSTTMPATTGRVWSAATSAELTAALSSAQPGDAIELSNGATFRGNFTLPAKAASSAWIIIRPADQSRLPAPGQRTTPAIAAAAQLPVIVSANNLGAISTQNGAHHWRIIGVEVTATATNTGLIRLGDPSAVQNTLAVVPHDLILDRVYAHGGPSLAARRCVALNSAWSAVIDSYLASCVDKGSDAQAIWGSNGPGPFLIENNYLEGSGENIMFGGADPAIPNLVPSDITIRHNHITKPLSWAGVWSVKNLFELKNAQRVLVEGNILENNWTDAQTGTAINIKAANQSGTCPWCTTQDVTFRLNIVRNAGSGVVLVGSDPGQAIHTQRLVLSDNLFANLGTATYTGDGRGIAINNDPTDAVVEHNTILAPQMAIAFNGGGKPVRFVYRYNVTLAGTYGVKASGFIAGTASLSQYMAASDFVGNVIGGASAAAYPGGNSYSASLSLTSDYRLTAGTKGPDGRIPGADIDALTAATRGVVVP